jgi:SAM-dependent methyltransferase
MRMLLAKRSKAGADGALSLPRSTLASPQTAPTEVTPARVNEQLWAGDHVARYANRSLHPVEVVLLARYQQGLSGRVLEIGCGAGRILGYLVALGGEVHGVDTSPRMLEYCRQTYPEALLAVGDLRTLPTTVHGPFDAIVAADNLLDVVDPGERRAALGDIRSLLSADGLLIFSSHNLAGVDPGSDRSSSGAVERILSRIVHMSPAQLASAATRLPRRIRNRRRLASLQRRSADYAVLNDSEGDYGALHYYVRRDAQEQQLRDAGFSLVECLDDQARPVDPGTDGRGTCLHYVAAPG